MKGGGVARLVRLAMERRMHTANQTLRERIQDLIEKAPTDSASEEIISAWIGQIKSALMGRSSAIKEFAAEIDRIGEDAGAWEIGPHGNVVVHIPDTRAQRLVELLEDLRARRDTGEIK